MDSGRAEEIIDRIRNIGDTSLEFLWQSLCVSDDEFSQIYPESIRKLSRRNWTPIGIAKMAAEFLVPFSGMRVLDIGSGAGKFCMVGSIYTPGYFTGVEQRNSLVELSNKLIESYFIKNVNIIHSNITEISFSDYDSFYFYNPFYEHIDRSALIDSSIEINPLLYKSYSNYVYEQLSVAKKGTRLVTYWDGLHEFPLGYELQSSAYMDLLKFWIKKK